MPEEGYLTFINQIYGYFFHKAHHNLLVLRNTRQHFSVTLGTILNSEITNKRHQNVKNVALIRLQKGHEFTT